MTQESLTFASSPFWPIAIGFFGLGTGYFIWGGQALFGYPQSSPEVDRTMGLWGFWIPGFCQFLTGVYLMVGLTWFNVFGNAAPLLHGRRGIHGVRNPLVRDGVSALRRVKRRTGRMDGHRLSLYFGTRSIRVWPRRRYPRHDYFHRFDLDLSRRSSNALGRVDHRRTVGSFVPMSHRNLAYVLHPGGHRKYCPGFQVLDLTCL